MVETKKISELTALEQVTEQTYLLVEQDGKACRLPISVLGEYLGTTGGTEEKELITFYIGDTECQATANMTWSEWLDSTFNNYITPITIVDDGLYAQEWDAYLYFMNEERAYGDTVIVSGHTYHWA